MSSLHDLALTGLPDPVRRALIVARTASSRPHVATTTYDGSAPTTLQRFIDQVACDLDKGRGADATSTSNLAVKLLQGDWDGDPSDIHVTAAAATRAG